MTDGVLFDVIIPIWNAPEWLRLCVETLVEPSNRRYLSQIILVDDQSDAYTKKVITELKQNYPDIVKTIFKEQNDGFVVTVNEGFKHLRNDADYILIQNSDCLVPPGYFQRLSAYFKKYSACGLLCPISNNAANLSLPMPAGETFITFDATLATHFDSETPYFKACTVVGNSLVVSKKCFLKVGSLNESYGRGYGEETDYQFRAAAQGFEAQVAPTIYVYHKGHVSFAKQMGADYLAYTKKNHALFLKNWGDDYQTLFKYYETHNPIEAIEAQQPHNNSERKTLDIVFVLPIFRQAIGGIHTVINILNYLTLSGLHVSFIVPRHTFLECNESLFFSPILVKNYFEINDLNIDAKVVVATAWDTFAPAYFFAEQRAAHLVYFIQGFEVYFQNGQMQAFAAETYRIKSNKIAVSTWLNQQLAHYTNDAIATLPTGYNADLFYPPEESSSIKHPHILFVLRGQIEKGDWLAKEVLSRCLAHEKISKITVLYFENQTFDIPDLNHEKLSLLKGPLAQTDLKNLFQEANIYVDFSFHEGFGLIPLESMACGAIAIVSDSGGIRDFVDPSLIVKEVNKPEAYMTIIEQLLSGAEEVRNNDEQNQRKLNRLQFKQTLPHYFDYFSVLLKRREAPCFESSIEQYRCLLKFVGDGWHKKYNSLKYFENFPAQVEVLKNELTQQKQVASSLKKENGDLHNRYNDIVNSTRWRFSSWAIRLLKDGKFKA